MSYFCECLTIKFQQPDSALRTSHLPTLLFKTTTCTSVLNPWGTGRAIEVRLLGQGQGRAKDRETTISAGGAAVAAQYLHSRKHSGMLASRPIHMRCDMHSCASLPSGWVYLSDWLPSINPLKILGNLSSKDCSKRQRRKKPPSLKQPNHAAAN